MARRNPLAVVTTNLPDEPQLVPIITDGRFYSEIKRKNSLRVLSVYTEYYHFPKLRDRNSTSLGKQIMEHFSQPNFKNHLKCLFIDSGIDRGEELFPSVMRDTMDDVIDFTFDFNESENLKIFSLCRICCYYCTVNFFDNRFDKLNNDLFLCERCALLSGWNF